MKLTDAVIKGREMLEPRQGNDLFLPDGPDCKYGGCYRGMAVVGAGAVKLPIEDAENIDIDAGMDLTAQLLNVWPWTGGDKAPFFTFPCACRDKVTTCEGGRPAELTVAYIIGHLWDKHVSIRT